jgi:hypothetical protein
MRTGYQTSIAIVVVVVVVTAAATAILHCITGDNVLKEFASFARLLVRDSG